MEIKDYKYRSTFVSIAKVITPPSRDRYLSQASLAPLKGIVPEGIDLDSPDLLYFAANGAIGGMRNLNGDAISCQTAVAINKTAQNKYIDIQHNREDICGCVLYPSFSKFGTNEPLTEAEASQLNEPFNMSVVGVIWKEAAPMVASFIYKNGDSTDEDSLSLSWEIAYNAFDLAVGGDNVFDAKIIPESDPSYAEYSKMLRRNGGTGKDKEGNNVFRVIKGSEDGDPIILGYGIVTRPAAAVKGILPLEASIPVEITSASNTLSSDFQKYLSEKSESGMGYHLCKITMNDGMIYEGIPVLNRSILPEQIDAKNIASIEIFEKSEIKSSNGSVTHLTSDFKPMKIESIEQLKTKWDEIRKLESSASVEEYLQTEIQKYGEQQAAKAQEEANRLKDIETAKASAEQALTKQLESAKELQASIDALKNEVTQLKEDAATAEAKTKFNERMQSLSEKFDLDEEDMKLIAADVNAIPVESDEAFAAYMTKQEKLLAAKMKKKMDDKEKKGDKKDDKEPDDDEDDNEDMTAKKKAKAAFASVEKIDAPSVIYSMTPVVNQTLKDEMAAAFGGSLTINGKTASELSEKKV